jgi:hypothetical protein
MMVFGYQDEVEQDLILRDRLKQTGMLTAFKKAMKARDMEGVWAAVVMSKAKTELAQAVRNKEVKK